MSDGHVDEPDAKRKILGGNAARFFNLVSVRQA